MIGAVDLDQLLRFVELRVELPDRAERNQLVAFAVDQKLRLRRLPHGAVVVAIDWRGNADQRADTRVLGTAGHRDVRPERETRRPELRARVARGEKIERRP